MTTRSAQPNESRQEPLQELRSEPLEPLEPLESLESLESLEPLEPLEEPLEEDAQWRLHLRRGIVARRLQRQGRRRALVARYLILLAAVVWVLVLWYLNQ